jgi:hypothetical protein
MAGQAERLAEILANLHERIREATDRGWLGEIEGLQISLSGARQKLQHAQAPPSGVGCTSKPHVRQ